MERLLTSPCRSTPTIRGGAACTLKRSAGTAAKSGRFHCGVVGDAALVTATKAKPKTQEARPRWPLLLPRLRRPFTATMGTIYEDSHIPLRKWLLATHLMNSNKRGISRLSCNGSGARLYRTAWFMAHRIARAWAWTSAASRLGGAGKIVEADETYHGRR